MPKYMLQASYTAEGTKGLIRDGGVKRREAAKELIESMGGTMESFYYAFGDTDAYGIVDMPDEASAVAVSLLIKASGAVELSLTPLIEPEVLDEAAKKNPSYRQPGA